MGNASKHLAKPKAPDDPNRFVAVSYLTDAKEYLAAARVLSASQTANVTSPQYFLIAQSIELFLKAFIIASGGTQAGLRKRDMRHSLINLAENATDRGYESTSEKTMAVIRLLDPHHAEHSFRYRKVGFKTYPTIREGLDTLSRMDREISPVVAASVKAL
jgi:HEPN domain-containing protein